MNTGQARVAGLDFATLFPVSSGGWGDDLWSGLHFEWKRPVSWMPVLGKWLAPRFRKDGVRRLKPNAYRDLCWDDTEWSDVLARSMVGVFDEHVAALAEALSGSVLRTFHGCRTEDAGSYHREGIRIHDRAELSELARRIVRSSDRLAAFAATVEQAIRKEANEVEDVRSGRLYVVADDRTLVKYAAHYLIYGSEWLLAVLGPVGADILKGRGVPTLVEIDLPLHMAGDYSRKALARCLLNEWTRFVCNRPDWLASIDFSFCLLQNIPPECVAGHSHPAELRDPIEGAVYQASKTTCIHCEQ
ncbi:hypothetical protein [Rhodovulum sp. PH10]|uniref:hypothetical protein n=1 Tax=Rhodovulum sp. PH10 TaxID=1187851 RepID=UPI0012F8BC03|nr:hypothetical protein [Rhodovulum sp. PH10]